MDKKFLIFNIFVLILVKQSVKKTNKLKPLTLCLRMDFVYSMALNTHAFDLYSLRCLGVKIQFTVEVRFLLLGKCKYISTRILVKLVQKIVTMNSKMNLQNLISFLIKDFFPVPGTTTTGLFNHVPS